MKNKLYKSIMIISIIIISFLFSWASAQQKKVESKTTVKYYNEDQKVLYSQACQLARSIQESDLQILQARLTDKAFLTKLDSAKDYEGQPTRLRVAGVLQILAENQSPAAPKLLLSLTTSSVFLGHRARVDLVIQALVQIKPAPQQAVVFWDKHFQPEDGYSGVTVWALLDNGSAPAIALFEKKMLDVRFPETERRYWLTACVLQHRNDLPLLQACERLLASRLEEPYRLLLVDVLFDYKPDEWYGAGHWYRPPLRGKATIEALKQLDTLGRKVLQNKPLSRLQRQQVQLVLREVEELLQSRKSSGDARPIGREAALSCCNPIGPVKFSVSTVSQQPSNWKR